MDNLHDSRQLSDENIFQRINELHVAANASPNTHHLSSPHNPLTEVLNKQIHSNTSNDSFIEDLGQR